MCGIAGFSDFSRRYDSPDWAAAAAKMGDTLVRRGPDEGGVWQSPHCVLAHRRLAVIDPERGHQPMTVSLPEGECALCYNGELYNTDDLRRTLAAQGVTFRTASDTEVLLWMCVQYGAKALDQLEGIFAFAFWDGRSKTLMLVRDRFGVKPLFYAVHGSTLLFGSERKALFAYPGFEARANEETWQEVLAMTPARTPGHGVFAGVQELQPGQLLLFDARGDSTCLWYTLSSRRHTESYSETVAHVRSLLQGAISRQLVSDVPLATLLSGGLDSSVITAVAARQYAAEGKTLDTYSFDYTDNDQYFHPSSFQPDADQPWVERMSRAFSTRHQTLICPIPQLADLLDQAMAAREVPGMGDVDSSLLWFCREIRTRHTVALSGECSDEIFGGYPWFHRADMLETDGFPWSMDFSVRTSVLRPEVVQRLKLEDYSAYRCRQSRRQAPPPAEEETALDRRRREVGWLNLRWFMASLLERKDRMSMYSGLEVRVPFCDHHLIDYVWSVPWEMKCRDGVRKPLLRDAAMGLLPEDVRNRPKSPYPKTHNPLFETLVRNKLTAILADPSAPIHSIVSEDTLRRGLLLSAGDYGKPWFGQLMAGPQMLAWLIQLNSWMEQYHFAL